MFVSNAEWNFIKKPGDEKPKDFDLVDHAENVGTSVQCPWRELCRYRCRYVRRTTGKSCQAIECSQHFKCPYIKSDGKRCIFL